MTQRDVENNKKTYTAFAGVEASRQAVRTLTHQGHEAIIDAAFPYPQRLIELSQWLMARHR
jgi:geranylgeranyl diphosphate synthase type II